MVQWLRLCISLQGTQVWSLLGPTWPSWAHLPLPHISHLWDAQESCRLATSYLKVGCFDLLIFLSWRMLSQLWEHKWLWSPLVEWRNGWTNCWGVCPLHKSLGIKKKRVDPRLLPSPTGIVRNPNLFQKRQWQPTPVLLAGQSHGWRNLVGCCPWSPGESDMTEWHHFHFSLSCIGDGNDNPLQCSCLENPRDEGAWWAAVYGVAQSRTPLKQLSSSNSKPLH